MKINLKTLKLLTILFCLTSTFVCPQDIYKSFVRTSVIKLMQKHSLPPITIRFVENPDVCQTVYKGNVFTLEISTNRPIDNKLIIDIVHEIGHIKHKHGNKFLKYQAKLDQHADLSFQMGSLFVTATALTGYALGYLSANESIATTLFGTIGTFRAVSLYKKYCEARMCQSQELEADTFAAKNCAFAQEQINDYSQKIEKMSWYQKAFYTIKKPYNWLFGTHPSHETRIENLKQFNKK